MNASRALVVVFETHATSVDNEAGLASGWFDANLSATGEHQARMLGARRRQDDFAAVFSSDLSRAVRTATIAFASRGLRIVRDPRLRECHYGLMTRWPIPTIEAVRREHLSVPFPEGESYEGVVRRVGDWLADARTTFAGRTVLVIGHRGTLYALEYLINKTPLNESVSSPWQWQPGWTYEVPM